MRIPNLHMTTWRAAVAISCVATVALLTTVCVMLIRANHADNAIAAAQGDASAAARDRVAAMLSYNAATVDKDLANAESGVTGSFRQDYRDLVRKTVIPVAKEKGVSTKASVVQVGVISTTTQHATLLLFIDQMTTSIDTPAPTVDASRVKVEMDHQGGQWLVSSMSPV